MMTISATYTVLTVFVSMPDYNQHVHTLHFVLIDNAIYTAQQFMCCVDAQNIEVIDDSTGEIMWSWDFREGVTWDTRETNATSDEDEDDATIAMREWVGYNW